MPMHFAPVPPGVLGDDMRELRGSHAVHIRGESLALLEMVPELAAAAVDAPPPNVNTKVLPYGKISWTTSPTLVADKTDLPLQPFVLRHVVDPMRHGLAFDALQLLLEFFVLLALLALPLAPLPLQFLHLLEVLLRLIVDFDAVRVARNPDLARLAVVPRSRHPVVGHGDRRCLALEAQLSAGLSAG